MLNKSREWRTESTKDNADRSWQSMPGHWPYSSPETVEALLLALGVDLNQWTLGLQGEFGAELLGAAVAFG